MGETVTVASKLPNGLVLRLFQMEDHDEPLMGGGFRTVKRAVVDDARGTVTIKGNTHPQDKAPRAQIVGGYALTPNVDAEFFAEWMKQNADLDMVKNGLIFAHVKAGMVEGKANEQDKVRSGLERIDPDNDPRRPRSVKTATEKEAA